MATYSFTRLASGTVKVVAAGNTFYIPGNCKIDPNDTLNRIVITGDLIDKIEMDSATDTINIGGVQNTGTATEIAEDLATDIFFLASSGSGGGSDSAAIQNASLTLTDDDLKNFLTTEGVQATGVLTVSGQPDEDDTFTIGVTVYTFKANENVATGTDIGIGADAAETRGNVYAVLATDTEVFIDPFSGNDAALTARAIGAAGNSIVTTSAATGVSFGAATLTGGVDAVRAPIELLPAPGANKVYMIPFLFGDVNAEAGAYGGTGVLSLVSGNKTLDLSDFDDALHEGEHILAAATFGEGGVAFISEPNQPVSISNSNHLNYTDGHEDNYVDLVAKYFIIDLR